MSYQWILQNASWLLSLSTMQRPPTKGCAAGLSCLLPSRIPMSGCATLCLSAHHGRPCKCFQLWVMTYKTPVHILLQAWVGHMFSFLLGTSLGVELLGHRKREYSTLQGTTFPRWLYLALCLLFFFFFPLVTHFYCILQKHLAMMGWKKHPPPTWSYLMVSLKSCHLERVSR